MAMGFGKAATSPSATGVGGTNPTTEPSVPTQAADPDIERVLAQIAQREPSWVATRWWTRQQWQVLQASQTPVRGATRTLLLTRGVACVTANSSVRTSIMAYVGDDLSVRRLSEWVAHNPDGQAFPVSEPDPARCAELMQQVRVATDGFASSGTTLRNLLEDPLMYVTLREGPADEVRVDAHNGHDEIGFTVRGQRVEDLVHAIIAPAPEGP